MSSGRSWCREKENNSDYPQKTGKQDPFVIFDSMATMLNIQGPENGMKYRLISTLPRTPLGL